MFRLLVAAALLAGLAKTPAAAEALNCTQFRERLEQALHSQGVDGAAALVYAQAEPGRPLQRLDWHAASGLSGILTCGPKDAFADFYMVTANRTPDLTLFKTIAAASACALSDGSPEACRGLVNTMTDDGLDQYRDDLAQKDDHPQGLQDYDVAAKIEAVFYVTPTSTSWAIGPGVFTTVEAARPALVPADRDQD